MISMAKKPPVKKFVAFLIEIADRRIERKDKEIKLYQKKIKKPLIPAMKKVRYKKALESAESKKKFIKMALPQLKKVKKWNDFDKLLFKGEASIKEISHEIFSVNFNDLIWAYHEEQKRLKAKAEKKRKIKRKKPKRAPRRVKMDAREWFKKHGKKAMFTDRFRDPKDALKYINKLYKAGAFKVEIEGFENESEDLYITLSDDPWEVADIMMVLVEMRPDEVSRYGKKANVVHAWWD